MLLEAIVTRLAKRFYDSALLLIAAFYFLRFNTSLTSRLIIIYALTTSGLSKSSLKIKGLLVTLLALVIINLFNIYT